MRLNWARTERRRAKLGKQLGRRPPPLDKQTRSRRWKPGGGGSGGTQREGAGRPARGRRAQPARRPQEPRTAGLSGPLREWRSGRVLGVPSQQADGAVGARGPRATGVRGKDGETSGGRRREGEVNGEKAHRGRGCREWGAGEEPLPRGKGRAMEEQAKGGARGRENWRRVKERDGR